MSNSRARSKPQDVFNFKTSGAYGRYYVEGKLPIEFVSTTLSMDKLSSLAFAKDIRTELDFDLLIQRDIDEERAIGEIGMYLSPDDSTQNGAPENNGIFLPPLIVAIVNTKGGKTLSESYPELRYQLEKDQVGEFYRRSWGDLFEIDLFPATSGASYEYLNDKGNTEEVTVDLTNCDLRVNIGGDSDTSGGRLVVIDGQHRLFALTHLMGDDEHRKKLKNLVIPICILFSPESTAENVKKKTPSIPAVLRRLFVDVNNNAKTVSGHFSILLSNENVGDLVCSNMCSKLLKESLPSGEGTKLSLLEWNTKANKESKTISKAYTVSSIGVIHEGLKDLFGRKNGIPVLEYLLNLDEVRNDFDFGEADDGTPLPQSNDFPWRDIPYSSKDVVISQVEKYFTPCLSEIFFETPAYQKIVELFDKKRKEVIRLSKERTRDATFYRALLGHLDNFEVLDRETKERKYDVFAQEFQSEFKKLENISIIRFNVFQKGMLTAWFHMLSIGQYMNLHPLHVTKLFTKVLQKNLDLGLFINDLSHTYLQESIFSGIKIKATKESRLQISRLISSLLGNEDFLDELAGHALALDEGIDADELKKSLSKLGDESATYYLNSLHSQLVKTLSGEYRNRGGLTSTQVLELRNLENAKNESKARKRKDKAVQLDDRFDKKIKSLIQNDFEVAKEQLEKLVGFGMVCDELMKDAQDDDNSEEN